MVVWSEVVQAPAWQRQRWPFEGPSLCLLAAVLQSQAGRKLRGTGQHSHFSGQETEPREARGKSEDTDSEALLLCSFAAPSREEVWLWFRLHSSVRGFKWNPKGYNGPQCQSTLKCAKCTSRSHPPGHSPQPLSMHGRLRRTCDLPVVTQLVSGYRGQD